ncbi:hypothetical protein HK096_007519, partial [Nowakowskiella sp. JEL0078]
MERSKPLPPLPPDEPEASERLDPLSLVLPDLIDSTSELPALQQTSTARTWLSGSSASSQSCFSKKLRPVFDEINNILFNDNLNVVDRNLHPEVSVLAL